MLRLNKYYFVMIKRRAMYFAFGSCLLLILIIIFSNTMGENPNPLTYSLFFLISSIVINLIGASLWYSLLVANHKLQIAEPLIKVFPFLKNKSDKVNIIFASVPSQTGHVTTGIGEARGLGILLENLQAINFPSDNIAVNYSDKYSDSDMVNILEKQNVILLGGPNFNKFTAYMFDKYHEKYPFVFDRCSDHSMPSPIGCNGNNKVFSGAIVNNTIRHEIVTQPEPIGATDDTSIQMDCGIIARIKNDHNKFVTILAGGMTSGVWVAVKLMTEYEFMEKWHTRFKMIDVDSEFMVVFQNEVENILTVNLEDINILKTQMLNT